MGMLGKEQQLVRKSDVTDHRIKITADDLLYERCEIKFQQLMCCHTGIYFPNISIISSVTDQYKRK